MKRNKLQERILAVLSFHGSDVIHWIGHHENRTADYENLVLVIMKGPQNGKQDATSKECACAGFERSGGRLSGSGGDKP